MKSLRVMKWYHPGLIVFLTILCSWDDAGAMERPQEIFNRGNYLMEQGNYNEALSLYREIEQNKFASGPLFLNMAICYVHIDSLGYAKYYFMKANNHAATRDRAGEGLDIIESSLNQRRGVLPSLTWISITEWLRFQVNTQTVAISGIVIFNLGVFFIIAAWFVSSFKSMFRYTGITTAGIGFLLIASGFILESGSADYDRAVMVEAQSVLLNDPGDDEDVVSLIYEGYTLTLDQAKSREHDGWKYVRLSNGLHGWVDEGVIRTL